MMGDRNQPGVTIANQEVKLRDGSTAAPLARYMRTTLQARLEEQGHPRD